MQTVFGFQYTLDGYYTEWDQNKINWLGEECRIQKFQGAHKNEFVITDSSNKSSLYYNGVLKRTWEGDCQDESGNFDVYENGRLELCGSFDNLLYDDYVQFKTCSRDALELVLIKRKTGITVYRGQYNYNLQKHGRGIEFDENDGKELLEGIWADDKLCKITKI